MPLSRLQHQAACHFIYVVCMPLSLRQPLDQFDAYGHDPKHPPGQSVLSCFLSSTRP
jgi:hypothetical protein